MRTAVKCEIVDMGPDHPDYFEGFGMYGTEYDYAVYGVGMNAKEAYNDAVDTIYTLADTVDIFSLDKVIPKRPAGIRKGDKLTKEQMAGEIYWHVGIRLKVK